MPARTVSLAAALYNVVGANPPLMPHKGLHIEWSTGSDFPCWNSVDNSAAWNACRDWVSGLTGIVKEKLSMIQIQKRDRGDGRKKIIVNLEHFDHTTSLDALAALVRAKAASAGTGIVGYAGTTLTGSYSSYLRDNQNTCTTTGGWSWFFVSMRTTSQNSWIHSGWVHLQCWLSMAESSNTNGKCARKFDLVAARIPALIQNGGRRGRGTTGAMAMWEIPVLMAQGNAFEELSCSFSRVNDNQYPQFADDDSSKTQLCSIGVRGPNGGPERACSGAGSFVGSIRFYKAGFIHTNHVSKVNPQ